MHALDIVTRLVAQGLEEGAFPSAAVAVGRGETLLYTHVAGVTKLRGGLPVTEDTLYDMASVTKLFSTAPVAWHAIERGMLTLDDTLGDFFDAPEDKHDITIRQLLTHTAGFAPSLHIWQACQDPEQVAEYILSQPLAYAPGTDVRYSCTGFITLGKLLEKVYGERLDALAKRLVFEPLGMRDTGYNPAFSPNIAATEIDPATGAPIQGVVHDENARFLGGVSGNAGIFSDVYDMIAFAQMLADGGGGYLSPAMLARATRCYTDGFDAHRGLGFHLGGTPCSFMGDLFPPCSFGHTGFTGTSLVVDPTTGFFVVLLTNRVHPTRESAGLFRFRRAFHNALYAAFSRADDQKTSFSLKNLHK